MTDKIITNKYKTDYWKVIFSFIGIILGIIILIASSKLIIGHLSFCLKAEKTEGTITQIYPNYQTSAISKCNFYPVVSYTDFNDKNHTFSAWSECSRSKDSRKVGDTLSVLYDRNDPSVARVNNTLLENFGLILGLFSSILFILLGISGVKNARNPNVNPDTSILEALKSLFRK